MSGNCPICTEIFTETQRKPITCAKCNAAGCLQCYKSYIALRADDPACMLCNEPMDEDYLRGIIPQAFWNAEFKISRGQNMLKREKSFISASMTEVETHKKTVMLNQKYDMALREVQRLTEMLKHAKSALKTIQNELHNGVSTENQKRSKSRIPCSSNDCKGFCDADGTCPVCNRNTCHKCLNHVDDNHICKQNDLETANYIFKNARPCPRCNQSIIKSEGCDQMYCVTCGTCYSWRTGNVETGRIHNPHAYENLGINLQREVLDEVCGGMPMFHYVLRSIPSTNKEIPIYFRFFEHIRRYPLREKFNYTTDLFAINLQDRVQYIMGHMTEKRFVSSIISRDKRVKRLKNLCDLYTMCVTVAEELFRFLVKERRADKIQTELAQIVAYMYEHFWKINKKYSSKEQFYTFNMSFVDRTGTIPASIPYQHNAHDR